MKEELEKLLDTCVLTVVPTCDGDTDLVESAYFAEEVREVMVQYARVMCEKQREICAEEAKVDWNFNAWYVDKESITNAPLPEEIQEPKGLKKLLKTWKAEELKLTSEEVKDYLLELFSNQSSELLNEEKIKIDVCEDSGVFSVLVRAGKTSYLTGVLGFLMYQPHQDILAVTYNGLILNKEQIEELFLRKERDYLPSNNTHD